MDNKFISYKSFNDRIIKEYPFSEIERMTFEEGRGYWIYRGICRWYRLCMAVHEAGFAGPFKVLDVGAFPFSALKTVKVIFPEASLVGAGLWDGNVAALLADDPILKDGNLQLCNFDPMIVVPEERQGIPRHFDQPDASIDFIIFTEVIEHLYNPAHVLKEISRVLKPGGRVYLTTNNVANWFYALRMLWGETNLDRDLDQTTVDFENDYPHDWRGHVRFYSMRQLVEMLGSVGIANVVQATTFDTNDVVPGQSALMTMAKGYIKGVIRVMPFMNRFRQHLEVVAKKS